MFDLFGTELPLAARFFIAFLVVLVLIGLTAWLVRRFAANRLGGANNRGRQPRLAVIDAASVDGRRRLVLIRRDNVEHLLMIGGPTDVVVEQNIVRGTPARETTRVEPALAAPLPSPAPAPTPAPASSSRQTAHAENSWPLQPVSESATIPAPRPYRAAATEEPWLPPEPGARARPVADSGSLTGLAAELSSRLSVPESVAPTVRAEAHRHAPPIAPAVAPPVAAPAPPPPAPPPVAPPIAAAEPAAPETSDHNLAEMAQQLEAALRRAPMPEGRPPVTDPLAVPPVKAAEPAARVPGRDYKLRVDPKFDTHPEAKFELPPEQRPEPRFEMPPEPRVDAKPQPAAAAKNIYDSLEEEMASLLGRPPGKT